MMVNNDKIWRIFNSNYICQKILQQAFTTHYNMALTFLDLLYTKHVTVTTRIMCSSTHMASNKQTDFCYAASEGTSKHEKLPFGSLKLVSV